MATQSESVTVDPALAQVPTALPGGETGVDYVATPSVTGGSGAVTWSVVDGTLPAGLALDPATGAITGTPTGPGSTTFTLRATDALGATTGTTETLTVVDDPATAGTRTVDGNVGVTMTVQLTEVGGTGPFSWSVNSGLLPSGLTIDPTTGGVTGTPTVAGTTSVGVTVSDRYGRHASGVVTFDVLPTALNSRSIATTPDGKGYWVATGDGKVAAFGDASSYGSMVDGHLRAPVVGIATTPDGRGYWLVASDGGVFAFGDAAFNGSAGATHLNQPVVGMAATPDGRGYWLVAADGGVFSYGTAKFRGSEGATHLNRPVVGVAATPDGQGYWLVASDGGVFTFGDASFHGSAVDVHLNQPVAGIEATPDGQGYWLAAADGGVFAYGDAGFLGADPAPLA